MRRAPDDLIDMPEADLPLLDPLPTDLVEDVEDCMPGELEEMLAREIPGLDDQMIFDIHGNRLDRQGNVVQWRLPPPTDDDGTSV